MTEKSNEEQLLEFLYACPVGLIECDLAGEIAVMNPHAMQHWRACQHCPQNPRCAAQEQRYGSH